MNGIWRVPRIGIGLLLLAAAVLKIHWQTHSPAPPHAEWVESPAVVFLASAFELCLGALLLCGAWSAAVRCLSICTFGLFACVAFTEAAGGSKSCGCFGGGVHIPPWIMAGFDSFCVILLLRCKAEIRNGVLFGLGKVRAAVVLAMVATGLTSAAVWATHRPPVVVAQSSQTEADADPFGAPGSLVLLEPDKWLGKPFLLGTHIGAGDQFHVGNWIILLVHHDCDVCALAVPKYQAASTPTVGAPKLAVVEMPPYAGSSESVRWSTSIGLFTKLDASRDWFATTPVAILLKDGIVRAAIDGDRAGTPDPSWR